MIHLKDFSIGFGTRTLLDKVNTSFGKGQLTALIGRNGSGKSTLLRAIAGLNRIAVGHIEEGGGFVKQHYRCVLRQSPCDHNTLAFSVAHGVHCTPGITLHPYRANGIRHNVFSTHELDVALRMCDSIALVDNGALHHLPVTDMVARHNPPSLPSEWHPTQCFCRCPASCLSSWCTGRDRWLRHPHSAD